MLGNIHSGQTVNNELFGCKYIHLLYIFSLSFALSLEATTSYKYFFQLQIFFPVTNIFLCCVNFDQNFGEFIANTKFTKVFSHQIFAIPYTTLNNVKLWV